MAPDLVCGRPIPNCGSRRLHHTRAGLSDEIYGLHEVLHDFVAFVEMVMEDVAPMAQGTAISAFGNICEQGLGYVRTIRAIVRLKAFTLCNISSIASCTGKLVDAIELSRVPCTM